MQFGAFSDSAHNPLFFFYTLLGYPAFWQFLRCDDEEEGETMLVVAGYHATWDWQFKYSGSEMCHNEVTRMHGDDVEEGT